MREIGVESKFDSEPAAETLAFVEGFEAFYRRERRPLIALAYAVSGSRVGAEDLAQDALEAAFRDWDRIRRKESPGTWVRRILLNKATSNYRRRITEAKVLAKSSIGIPTVAFPDVTGDIDRIWAEVRRLPRRQVQVIALTYMECLSQVEIGATLGISKESVNTHLRRARRTLAESLRLEES